MQHSLKSRGPAECHLYKDKHDFLLHNFTRRMALLYRSSEEFSACVVCHHANVLGSMICIGSASTWQLNGCGYGRVLMRNSKGKKINKNPRGLADALACLLSSSWDVALCWTGAPRTFGTSQCFVSATSVGISGDKAFWCFTCSHKTMQTPGREIPNKLKQEEGKAVAFPPRLELIIKLRAVFMGYKQNTQNTETKSI